VDAASADELTAIAEESREQARRVQRDATTPVEERYPDLLDALDWCLAAGRPDQAFRLASALVPFWIATTRIDDGDAWFSRALATAVADEAARTRALHDHGYLVFWQGRYELARQRFADSLSLAERLGDASLQALALAGLARVALNSDMDEAVSLLRHADAVSRDLSDSDHGRSSALHVLGVALQMSGDLLGARKVMSARLAMGRSSGDQFIVWVESANLSMVERQLGHLDRAEQLILQALTIDSTRGDEMSIAWTINGLAAVTAAKGAHQRAATLVGIAAAMLERAGGQWPPDERKQHEETLSTLTTALSPDELRDALTRGAGLSVTDAVAFALAVPG